jgi:hypothetical protein
MLVLAALWWAWSVYAWLTSAIDVDEGGVRLVMLASMGAMFGVALAVPGTFGDDAVVFGVAYLLVRLLHLVLSATVARDDPDRLGALLRFAPTAIFGASLLVLAGFLEGNERIAVWAVALAIDYLGPRRDRRWAGLAVAPEHFAERHGLIILIALGESMIAIGVGLELGTGVTVGAALGIVVVSALWWLYCDFRAGAAHPGAWPRTAPARAARLQLPSPADVRWHRALCAGPHDDAQPRRRIARHRARSRAMRWRGALPAWAHRVSLPNDWPGLPAADDRDGRVARPRPGCTRNPGARGARPGERRVLANRGVRGDPLPRGSSPDSAPRARGVTSGCRLETEPTTSWKRGTSASKARK